MEDFGVVDEDFTVIDEDNNTSNSSNHCFNFTATQLEINTAVTVTLHTVAILASVLVILFIIAAKQYRVFVNRLILYLMIVGSIWSFTIMIEIIPVVHDGTNTGIKVRDGWGATCAIMGFLSQIAETAKIMMVCWIVLYLLLLVVFRCNASKLTHEVLGLVTIMVVPLLVDWVPFRWGSYGLSGLWCWIELTKERCGGDIWLGLGLMLGVDYVPMLLVVVFTVVSFICVTVSLCKRAHTAEIKWKWTSIYKKGLAEATAIMIYPCVYVIIFTFRLIHRTCYAIQISKTAPPSYTLWLAHSTALGIGGILVPLMYILRPSNLRKFYFCRKFCFGQDSSSAAVYRSSSVASTEAVSEGDDLFSDTDHGTRDSGLFYRSILNSHVTK